MSFYCPKCGKTADGASGVAMVCAQAECPAKMQMQQANTAFVFLLKLAAVVVSLFILYALGEAYLKNHGWLQTTSSSHEIAKVGGTAKADGGETDKEPDATSPSGVKVESDDGPAPVAKSEERQESAVTAPPSASIMTDQIAKALDTGASVLYRADDPKALIQVSAAAPITGGSCRTVAIGSDHATWCQKVGEPWKLSH